MKNLTTSVVVMLCSHLALAQPIPVLDGEFEKLATTSSIPGWLEGPAYDGMGGIWFTDLTIPIVDPIGPPLLFRYDIATGELDEKLRDTGGANGLAFDPAGFLIAAHGDDKNLTRRAVDTPGEATIIVDDYGDRAFSGPNDIAFDAYGGFYFTDPSVDLSQNSVFHVSSSYEIQRVATGIWFNNGIAISPDGDTLYVASTLSQNIVAFDINDDATLSNQRTFVDSVRADGRTFTPDGMAIDPHGNVFVADLAVPGGPEAVGSFDPTQGGRIWAFDPLGEPVLRFDTPDNAAANLLFGPDDMLYLTATDALYRVPISYVPEPAGAYLACFAIVVLQILRRRVCNVSRNRTDSRISTMVVALLVIHAGLGGPGTHCASATEISSLVVFGDSLSDAGNLAAATPFAPSPPYFEGRITNGPNWIDRLAFRLSVPAPTPSSIGGTNFAFGGATTGSNSQNELIPDMDEQVETYLSSNTPSGDELIVLWGGVNDFNGGQTQASLPVESLSNHVTTLANAGARNLLVVNIPETLGQFNYPLASESNLLLAEAIVSASANYPTTSFVLLDYVKMFDAVQNSPGNFGFTEMFEAACTDCGESTVLAASDIVDNPEQYFFWDDIHPSAAAHQLIGDAAFAIVVPEPSNGRMLFAVVALSLFAMRRRR